MKKAFFLFWLSAFGGPVLATQDPDGERIRFILDRQIECWNNADIECFMEAYWKSDSLKFIGSEGVIYGWGSTLQRYKLKYPDPEAMGQLRFEILSMENIGADGFYVVGKFHLSREELEDLDGFFSLLWRKIGSDWRIVADHTS